MIITVIAAMLLAAPGVPMRATVMTGPAARETLAQCSRDAPAAGSGFFRPTPAQIRQLDRAVAASRNRRLPTGAASFPRITRTYAVEAVGIARGGRRFVYGNYFPLSLQEGIKEAPPHPTVVCDGGRTFFGAEIDIGTGRITHIDFNGPG